MALNSNSIIGWLLAIPVLICIANQRADCSQSVSIPILDGNLIKVQLGTPPKAFRLMLDTGSANTWIFDQSYNRDHPNPIKKFYPSESTTFKLLDTDNDNKDNANNWAYDFGINLFGYRANDVMKLSTLELKQQEIGLVSHSNSWLSSAIISDGSLGFGSLISGRKSDEVIASNPIQTAVNHNQLNERLFSIHLEKEPRGNQVGKLVLGAINEDLYEGDVDYVPISEEFWKFQFNHLSVTRTHRNYSKFNHAIMDSTSNLIVLPTDANYYINLYDTTYDPEVKLLKFDDCDVSNQPSLIINIQDKDYIMKAEELVLKISNNGVDSCYLALDSKPQLDRIVLGVPFMKKYYTIHDYANKRIGFAKSKQTQQQEDSPTNSLSLMDLINNAAKDDEAKDNAAEDNAAEDNANGDDNSHGGDELDQLLEKIRENLNIDDDMSDSDDDNDDEDKCPICRIGFSKRPFFDLVCGHKFHIECIGDFYEANSQMIRLEDKVCFICRQPLVSASGKCFEKEVAKSIEKKKVAEARLRLKLQAEEKLAERVSFRNHVIQIGVRSNLAYVSR